MAKQNLVDDPEMNALMHVDGIDTEKLTRQLKGEDAEGTPPVETPSVETPPVETPPAEKPPETNKNVPDQETVRKALLDEMFGGVYQSVEDVKKANIPGVLKDLETSRGRIKELETQLSAKPKHNFASDDIAKLNEFVKETGIKDPVVFSKLNGSNLTDMDDMNVLIMGHIIDNPEFAGAETRVRRYFERKYGVDPSRIDPALVESGDLTQEELDQRKASFEDSMFELKAEAKKVRNKLAELKEKIKMPEPPAEEPDKTTKWTPETEKTQKEAWTKINEAMGAQFAQIPIKLDGAEEPLLNFALSEENKKNLTDDALAFVVSNQMEVNEDNVTAVATQMYNSIIVSNLSKIAHAIFERARTITEDELLKVYHHPSDKNIDTPPADTELKGEEKSQSEAYRMEMGE